MKRQISLNGQWRFTHELDQRPDNNHSVYQGRCPLYACGVLNRQDWMQVDVPGVWERYAEKYTLYEGVGWYFRDFTMDEIGEETIAVLRFGGVIYRADIYLNEQYVGYHESGYVPFAADVTGKLEKGVNHLAVRVDNRPLLVKWPHDWGYFNFGGIHGDVTLELMDGAYIKDLSLTPDWDTDTCAGLLRMSGILCRSDKNELSVTLGDRTLSVQADESGAFDTVLTFSDVSPWSPDAPVLYPLTVTLDGSVWEEKKIGFRHIAAHGTKLWLNGAVLHCSGCCYLYDSPQYGLVQTREQLTIDLCEMKAAGVNAVRTHYPMGELFYELCDEMGLVSWIELPVYCSKPANEETNTVFARPDYIENAQMILREMIAAARSHASVVIYSIGNECNVEHPEAMPFFTTMAQTVRMLDATRLVGYAALYGLVGQIGSLLDVIGINCYEGWYGRISSADTERQDDVNPAQTLNLANFHALMKSVRENLPPDLPIVLSEFGGDSVPGFRSSNCDFWSEDYHAVIVKAIIEAAGEHPDIAGTFVFAFTDYGDPSKPRNGRWNEYNLKGMLTYERVRKRPFYALQQAYTGKSEEEI